MPRSTVRLIMPDGFIVVAALASTRDELQRGLQGVSNLPAGTGMLLAFGSDDVHKIHMRGCLVPLDILWLGEHGVIVQAEYNVPPCHTIDCPVYGGNVRSCYVLELPAGTAKQHGGVVGVVGNTICRIPAAITG
jgi:uncharacterized membrane protein (UPF0127 family)